MNDFSFFQNVSQEGSQQNKENVAYSISVSKYYVHDIDIVFPQSQFLRDNEEEFNSVSELVPICV